MKAIKVIGNSFGRFSDLINYLEKCLMKKIIILLIIKSLKKKNLQYHII